MSKFMDALKSGDFGTMVGTLPGQIIIGILAIVLLLVAVSIGGKSKDGRFNVQKLVYSGIAIAIAMVLSQIKIFTLPQGGSVTPFSMLFIVLIGYWFGTAQGILCGVSYGLLQLVFGGYVVHPLQLLLDYPLAFGALGLSGLFKGTENGLLKGLIIGAFGRFVFAFLSGYVFFSSYAWEGFSGFAYSVAYNISYIGTEVFLTAVILMIPAVNNAFVMIKKQVHAAA